jgi:hypothetical protein
MKKLLNGIWSVLVSIGQARCAAYYARTGQYKLAQEVYTK